MLDLTEILAPAAVPLAEALLNGLWQGLVVMLLAAALLRMLPLPASGRYAVLYLALVVITGIPLIHLAGGPHSGDAARTGGVFAASSTPAPEVAVKEAAAPLVALPLRVEAGAAVVFVLSVWLLIAMALCGRVFRGYLQLARVKAKSERVGGLNAEWWRRWTLANPSERHPELRTCEVIRLPVAAGLGRPAILFPKRLLQRLSEEEAYGIWLHELAHILRLDDWTKLTQRVAEAVFFFNPAVLLIGRRMNLEREIACDEWAVARAGSAKPYAACLARLAEFASLAEPSLPAPAMASDRKQIFRRVEMLVNKNKKSTKTESRVSAPFAVSLLLAVAVVLLMTQPLFVVAAPASAQDEPQVIVTPAAQPTPVPAPAPAAAPAAAPVPAVAPPAPEVPQVVAPPGPPAPPKPLSDEWRAEMEAHRAEMRELARQIREEVHGKMKINRDEMRRLAEEIRATVHERVKPKVEEIKKLQLEMHLEKAEDVRRDMAERMAEVEREIEEVTQTELRALEDRMAELQERAKPSEETIRKLEEKAREMAEKMQEKEREYRRKRKENNGETI